MIIEFMKIRILFAAISFAFVLGLRAADPPPDLDGVGNPLHFKRYEGSRLFRFSEKKFDALIIPLGMAQEKDTFEKSAEFEGEVQKRTYVVSGKRSALEVFRNYRKELDAAGWQTLWEGKGADLGVWFPSFWDDIGDGETFSQYFAYSPDAMCYWAGKLETPEGTYHAALVVTEFQDGAIKFAIEKGDVIVQVNTVRAAEMDKKMVVVKADQMENSIKSGGRVTLYGILFDFNKADVKPESAPTLAEIAKLLQSEPELKLLVAGHTDNVGGFEFNRDLSTRRAKAVVAELTGKYGISPERLFPFGVSFASPLAPNETEEGRAKNRRVELVKM
jgi:outer membrane protein OmpA-like peptidoglycan-associated protein